jgi:hypothetical protein
VKKTVIIIGIIIVFPVLFGCNAYKTQRELVMDKDWGRSTETYRFSQIENPDAGETIIKDQGIDGKAAGYNYDKYQKSFKKDQAPSQVFNINVGGQ